MTAKMVKTMMAMAMAEGTWTASAEHLNLRDVNGLVPNMRNARARWDQRIADLARSNEFGYANPIRVGCHDMMMACQAPLLGVGLRPVIFAKRSSR